MHFKLVYTKTPKKADNKIDVCKTSKHVLSNPSTLFANSIFFVLAFKVLCLQLVLQLKSIFSPHCARTKPLILPEYSVFTLYIQQKKILQQNSVDPDQTAPTEQADHDLHCLPKAYETSIQNTHRTKWT